MCACVLTHDKLPPKVEAAGLQEHGLPPAAHRVRVLAREVYPHAEETDGECEDNERDDAAGLKKTLRKQTIRRMKTEVHTLVHAYTKLPGICDGVDGVEDDVHSCTQQDQN